MPNVTPTSAADIAATFPTKLPFYPTSKEKPCPCKSFEYAVKIVSGNHVNSPGIPPDGIIASGQYYTDINIHNPSTCSTITFKWRVSIGLMVSDPITAPFLPWSKFTLRPGQSIEIDSPNILRATDRPFTKGFVLIETPCELDIVAVYTSASSTAGSVATFHTERVPAREVDSCCDDLSLDISTGIANWQLVAATDLSNLPLPIEGPCQAATMDPTYNHPVWGAAQTGTKWLSVNHFGKNPFSSTPYPVGFLPGFYTFQTCFTLCSGFEKPAINFNIMVDDLAQVWFNGIQITASIGNYSSPVPVAFNPAHFLPGLNCITVVILNSNNPNNPNPVGLNIKGVVTAKHGACSDGCGCCG